MHPIPGPKLYDQGGPKQLHYPNFWDALSLCVVLSFLGLLAIGAKGMIAPYHTGQPILISLSPRYLPYYAFRSVLRMGVALFFSLVFTFFVGTLAAKNKNARSLIIPLLDILQSVPVLGYLSITVVPFIALFPNSILGPECAAIFAVFTAQVWNITFSFYQSLRTLPVELLEVAHMFHLGRWQRFFKLEVPFAMPGLVWNSMMSMSGSWFFVVASEAITVNNQNITLPGIGSYIALAVARAQIDSVCYAIIAMFIVILLYDQILFRPLNDWLAKFQFEETGDEPSKNAWIVQIFRRTRWFSHLGMVRRKIWDLFTNFPTLLAIKLQKNRLPAHNWRAESKQSSLLWPIFLVLLMMGSSILLAVFIFNSVPWRESLHVIYLGAITALRVLAIIILSSLFWIPVSVFIGMRPGLVRKIQPLIQFLASFPVNLLYPVAVILIVRYHLNPNIWTAPLMILGSQWYIAFNIISGVSVLPKDLRQVATLFQVKGWLWWKRFILPGIFPYYITGAITASGGAWNASIIAEVLNWGHTKIMAVGLGAYITAQSTTGDFPRLTLGIGIMCLYVLVINRLLWQPLYQFASEKFRIS